jgi:hypothetical protein
LIKLSHYCIIKYMAYKLCETTVERVEDPSKWVRYLSKVRRSEIGVVAVSLHPNDVAPAPVLSNLGASAIQLNRTDIDKVTDGNFSAAFKATKPRKHKEWLRNRSLSAIRVSVGAHFDRSLEDVRPAFRDVAVTAHYTPYGRGVLEVARLICSPEELAALSTWEATDSAAEELAEEFESVAVALPFEQGDMLGFIAHGQLLTDGMAAPLMHRFSTTSDLRYTVTSTN